MMVRLFIHVGKYLTRTDIASSLRVCRNWNEALLPALYHTVILNRSARTESRPTKTALLRYRHLVRDLTLNADITQILAFLSRQDQEQEQHQDQHQQDITTILLCSFSNHSRLNLTITGTMDSVSSSGPEYGPWNTIAKVLLNPKLSSLRVSGSGLYFGWRAFRVTACPALNEHLLADLRFTMQEEKQLYTLVSRLTKLELKKCRVVLREEERECRYAQITAPKNDSHQARCPNLRHLSVDHTSNTEFDEDLILDCPSLQTFEGIALRFENDFNSMEFNVFYNHFRSMLWQKLERLTMTELSDSFARQIINACAPLKKIDVQDSRVSYGFLKALERHY
ncbi:hypothetical protein BGZ83_002918, partial [Gryganskiella cystojenkinii]